MKSVYKQPSSMGFIWVSAFALFKRCWLTLTVAYVVGALAVGCFIVACVYIVMSTGVLLVDLPVSLGSSYGDIGASSMAQLQSLHAGLPPALLVPFFIMLICGSVALEYVLVDIAMCKLCRKPVAIWHSLVFIFHRLHWVLLGSLLSALVVILSALPALGLMYVAMQAEMHDFMWFLLTMLLMLFYVPVFYMLIGVLFVNYFIIYDRYSPWRAVVASIALVKGRWWRVFGMVMVPGFVLLLVSLVVSVIVVASTGAVVLVTTKIVLMVLFQYLYCLHVCIYQDLLARRDTKEIVS